MADAQEILHDVLAALVQGVHRGGYTPTDKAGQLGENAPSDEEDAAAAAVTAAIAAAEAAETAAATAAAAEAAAVAARGRSRWRAQDVAAEALATRENQLAADTDVLMAFVVLHLLRTGFRPDVGCAIISEDQSFSDVRRMSFQKSARKSPEHPLLSEHPVSEIGDEISHRKHNKPVSSFRRRRPHQGQESQDRDGKVLPSHIPPPDDANYSGNDATENRPSSSGASKYKSRTRRLKQETVRSTGKSKSRSPKDYQTYTRRLQFEQRRQRRLKAIRLQQTRNSRIANPVPTLTAPINRQSVYSRKRCIGDQFIKGNWSSISKRFSSARVAMTKTRGSSEERENETNVESKVVEKKRPIQLSETQIMLNDIKRFITTQTFSRCAKMVKRCGWTSVESGSYSMFLTLPPLKGYRFSLIGLPAAWHDVLVVNLAVLPDKNWLLTTLDYPTNAKYTPHDSGVGAIAYTVAIALSEYIRRTPDGPRLKIERLCALVSLLGNSLSLPAACAARTACGVLNPSLLGLPARVALLIISYLRVKDVLQVAKTCRALNALCKEQDLWKYLVVRDFGPLREGQGDKTAYIDWSMEYWRYYQAEHALADRAALENATNSLMHVTQKSCGVNAETMDVRKSVKIKGTPSVTFDRLASEPPVLVMASRTSNHMIRQTLHRKRSSRERVPSKTVINSHGKCQRPEEVLSDLCSYGNITPFNFDDLLDKDGMAVDWKSPGHTQIPNLVTKFDCSPSYETPCVKDDRSNFSTYHYTPTTKHYLQDTKDLANDHQSTSKELCEARYGQHVDINEKLHDGRSKHYGEIYRVYSRRIERPLAIPTPARSARHNTETGTKLRKILSRRRHRSKLVTSGQQVVRRLACISPVRPKPHT